MRKANLFPRQDVVSEKALLSDDELIAEIGDLAIQFQNALVDGETNCDVPRIGPSYGAIGFLRMSDQEHDFCAKFERLANPRMLLGRSDKVHKFVDDIRSQFPRVNYEGYMRRVKSSGVLFMEYRW